MTIIDAAPLRAGQLIQLDGTSTASHQHRRVAAAVAAVARGQAAVLCDDYEHPSRGELIYAAACASIQITAFAVRHTSGFLHVALTEDRCVQLGLVPQNAAHHAASSCVTVDAKTGVGTGVSAADRATTARLLAAPTASANSFTRPGHVVPLRAQLDTPACQYGLAESAVRLAIDAGLPAAAVLGTIVGVSDPTDIAAGVELIEFAHRHALPLVGVDDIWAAHPASDGTEFSFELATLAGRTAHISHTGDVENGFVRVVLGEVAGRSAVPLHIVAAHRLKHEVAQDSSTPAILIGVPHDEPGIVAGLQAAVSQPGTPVHTALRSTGARSVWIPDTVPGIRSS